MKEVKNPKKNNNLKLLIISTTLLLLVTIGLVLYYNDRLDKQNKVFNAKLLILNNEMNNNLNQLENNLEVHISTVNKNLTGEIDLVDNDLRNFKSANKKEISTLNNLIDEIEKQSEIQLGELKDELKSIKVDSNDFTAIIDDVLHSVVSVGTNIGIGSGVVVDDSGFIVTNYHVVNRASRIRILTYEDDIFNAELIGFNDVVDIAVLKVDTFLPELKYADSDDVEVGERVIALGNPVGLSFTVTEGIISALNRVGPNNLDIYLQTDVPINPGNSGGPLVDINSRIVGINNFKIGGFEGLGFAIESNTVEDVVDDIITQYLLEIAET